LQDCIKPIRAVLLNLFGVMIYTAFNAQSLAAIVFLAFVAFRKRYFVEDFQLLFMHFKIIENFELFYEIPSTSLQLQKLC
jgi:hypothetical protein